MSFFKGFGELYVKTSTPSNNQGTPAKSGLAIVQEVFFDGDENAGDVGKIRVKPVNQVDNQQDDEITIYAYPADRRSISYPLPGEQVFVFSATSNEVDAKNRPISSLYYNTTLSQSNSITYNTLPNIGNRISEPSTLVKR